MNLVAIIESTGANFASIQAALMSLGMNSIVTRDAKQITEASHVILPGVGAAGHAMTLLRDQGLSVLIPVLTQPVLGICLGMQLLCDSSEEDQTDCLGIIPLAVSRLSNVKIIPHMGWDNLSQVTSCDLLKGITTEQDFYFVHGYVAGMAEANTLAACDYGAPFSAVIQKDNFCGVQFHPEKSGEAGNRILENFVRLS